MHGVKDVGQAEIHTAEPLVPEPSSFEVELAIGKLKSHKSPGIDEIPAKSFKAGGGTISVEIHMFSLLFGRKRNCMKSGRSLSYYLFIGRGIKQIVIIIGVFQFCQPHTKLYLTFCSQG